MAVDGQKQFVFNVLKNAKQHFLNFPIISKRLKKRENMDIKNHTENTSRDKTYLKSTISDILTFLKIFAIANTNL